jgi:D-3-phosphoglycerate dehydrogenase / 2-oxoglutarate reductase
MATPLVLITEPIAPQPMAWLGDRCTIVEMGTDDPRFPETLARAHALIVRTYTHVDQSMLDNALELRVVGRAGVGLDNIDLNACTARGVRVVNTPHANALAVVEYTVSMLISTLRPINRLKGAVDLERWHQLREDAITPRSVVGTPLGIIGLGHIGSRVARVAGALGMRVCHHDLKTIDESNTHGSESRSLETLLSQSECVCVHVDGRAQNHGFLSDQAFALMHPDVVFINASRGFVVDSDAAARFAVANPRASLVLDVHDPEPIGADSPLLGLPNVILTPHIAAATTQAKTEMSWVVRDVWAVLSGHHPESPAN